MNDLDEELLPEPAALPQHPSFLLLPPEIRNQIYNLLSPLNSTLTASLPLRHTCKQIHHEYDSLILANARTARTASITDSTTVWRTHNHLLSPPLTVKEIHHFTDLRNIEITFPICFHKRRSNQAPTQQCIQGPSCNELLLPLHFILALHIPYVTIKLLSTHLSPLDMYEASYRWTILKSSFRIFKEISKRYEVNAQTVIFDFSPNTHGPLRKGAGMPYIAFVRMVKRSGGVGWKFLGRDPWPGDRMAPDWRVVAELEEVMRRSRRVFE